MLQGGVHGLASAVQMHLPSTSSAPTQRRSSGRSRDAPSAHPALESPLCARDATVSPSRLDCSSSTNSIPETGF
eukprot:5251923-Prymnesium_polylepis.1